MLNELSEWTPGNVSRGAPGGAGLHPVLEQSVEHVPGEDAMRAATLQGKSNPRVAASRRTRFRHTGKVGYGSVEGNGWSQTEIGVLRDETSLPLTAGRVCYHFVATRETSRVPTHGITRCDR
jgi:hypothetical protein